jgi:hypothetical protein
MSSNTSATFFVAFEFVVTCNIYIFFSAPYTNLVLISTVYIVVMMKAGIAECDDV